MLFYLLLIGFTLSLAACWLYFAIAFGIAKCFKKPGTARSLGKIWAGVSVVAVLGGAIYWFLFFPPARVVYAREFGESPTPDVKNLHSSSSGGYDSQITLLKFQAAPSTIQRLVSLRRLHAVPIQPFDSSDSTNLNTPEWWKPNSTPHSREYELEKKNQSGGFFNESTWLLYDPQTQTAHYSFFGVD